MREKTQMFNPIVVSLTLLPLLFIVLILITYLNVLETKRTKSLDEKLSQMCEYIKAIAEKLTENDKPCEKSPKKD